MKKYLTLIMLAQLAISGKSFSQNIAINGTGALPDTSAMLDVSSTNKGLLAPRMTTTQQNAIPLPATGLLIFNITDNAFKVNTGTTASPVWSTLSTGSAGIGTLNTLTGTSQSFATGTTGADFNIASSGTTHTFSIPDAGAAARGFVSIGAQTFAGNKTFTGATTLSGSLSAGSTINFTALTAGASTDSILTVNASTGAIRRLSSASLLNSNFWNTTGNSVSAPNNILGTLNNTSLRLFTNNTERMVIDNSGNTGIGVTDPGTSLVVKDNIQIRRSGSTAQLIFTNTSGSGDFRLGGDGGDIYWQGGGGRSLQMGSFWATVLIGDRQTSTLPAFQNGITGTSILVASARDASVPLGVQANSATQTANLTEWRNSAGTVLSVVDKSGNIGAGTSTPGSKLDVKGTLRLSGSTSGYVGFQPAAAAGSVTYTLPSADGTNGQQLVTNGSGILSWASAATSSSSSGWGLTGNSGTSSATNYIGTSDNQPIVFKVNGTQAGFLGISGSSYATAWGIASSAGFQSTAIGAGATATANNEATAVGYNAIAAGYRSIAMGSGASTNSNNESIAIGSNSKANIYQGIALGSGATSSIGNTSMAIGVNANATGYQSLAMGNGASASGQNSTAIGNGATVTNDNYISIGNTSVTAIRGQVNFTTYSDGRFKKNIKADVPGLDFVLKLRPVTYTWDIHKFNAHASGEEIKAIQASYNPAQEEAIRKKESITYTGFIAQEVERAAQQTNFNFSGVLKPQNDKDAYSVSYAEFVVPLVKAAQELNQQNEILAGKIAAQQKLIEQLIDEVKALKKH